MFSVGEKGLDPLFLPLLSGTQVLNLTRHFCYLILQPLQKRQKCYVLKCHEYDEFMCPHARRHGGVWPIQTTCKVKTHKGSIKQCWGRGCRVWITCLSDSQVAFYHVIGATKSAGSFFTHCCTSSSSCSLKLKTYSNSLYLISASVFACVCSPKQSSYSVCD